MIDFNNNVNNNDNFEVSSMTNISLKKLMKNGKFMFLACDQGLEHGPKDFNEKNIDPKYIFDIALEGNYSAIIVEPGVAEKYYRGPYKSVPLIVKLNGKTSIPNIEPRSTQHCSVARALKMGASAVGYTIFVGSRQEPEIFAEFGKIVEEAHDFGLPVVAWVYARGEDVKNELSNDILAYAARIGLELGADIVKIKYNGDPGCLKWMKQCAGKTKMVISGGSKDDTRLFLDKVHTAVNEVGVDGLAVGRNVWQSDRPFSMSKALERIIFHKAKVDEVMHYFK